MDEKKLREEFKKAHDDNIAQLIKEGNYVNYDYAVMSDFETFKKCREVEEEIKEKGLNIERLNRLNEIKRKATDDLFTRIRK